MALIVKIEELDPRLPKELKKNLGGENALKCFQCGSCVATCIVSRVDPRFNVRVLIKRAVLGFKDVLKDPLIWVCSTCESCIEKCPQGVKPYELLLAIKNLAVKKGFFPSFIEKILEEVCRHGRIYEINEFINWDREEQGLPPLKEEVKPPSKVLDLLKVVS